jgi:hypothetical protein
MVSKKRFNITFDDFIALGIISFIPYSHNKILIKIKKGCAVQYHGCAQPSICFIFNI